MRYHLFLHYGWFLQNLGKDFIRTNMHTTVFLKGNKLINCLIDILSFFPGKKIMITNFKTRM